MDRADDRLRELEEAVRLLTIENDSLAERSEDTLLLGLIAEKVGATSDIDEILEIGLEQIALLKDVPFCACCLLEDGRLRVKRAYLAFTNLDLAGASVPVSPSFTEALAAGSLELTPPECSDLGLDGLFGGFVPSRALVVAFEGHAGWPGLFLFADHRADSRLPAMAVMLNRTVELITSHLDTHHLLSALRDTNLDLDRRVAERTADLHAAVAELEQQVADRKRAEAALQTSLEEHRKSQDQLRQAQKMESVGRLAGGVAHDFNNLLTSILGNVELVLEQVDPADPISGPLSDIRLAGESAASLTRQLLAFSRKQIIDPRVLALNDVIANMQRMLRRIIGEDIEFVTALDERLRPVRADPGQIEQVLVNLCVNARDAMPGGGRLEVMTLNVDVGEEECLGQPDARPGPHVEIVVRDTGVGISDDARPHVFEPFFTTKTRGTGLGLSMVYGAARQNGGFVTLESEVGRGTTFRVFLPATAPVDSPPAAAVGRTSVGGTETIVIVEDDDLVRELAQRVLARQGYTVLAYASGEAAVRAAAQHAGNVDLLVTDVVLPGMNGRDVAARFSARWPDLRVLFTSGYTDDVIVRLGVFEGGLQFIGKPYTPQVLAAKVRTVLDK